MTTQPVRAWWPVVRFYGRTHLGRIQSAAQGMTVVASAVGPVWLAWCVDLTGSYAVGFYVLAGTVLVVAGAAAVVPMPTGGQALVGDGPRIAAPAAAG